MRERIWIVLSCAVTSERVLGRYFSTHGCRRAVSVVGLEDLDEEEAAAAAWRALRLKKSAMVVGVGGCRGDGSVCLVEM